MFGWVRRPLQTLDRPIPLPCVPDVAVLIVVAVVVIRVVVDGTVTFVVVVVCGGVPGVVVVLAVGDVLSLPSSSFLLLLLFPCWFCLLRCC